MKFNIDYHFHPNLPKNNTKAINKCIKWWKEIKNNNINTVIVTEHIYKNPKRAHKLMLSTKPKDCYLFPGMEYITKEGVDIIIFSNNDNIYNLNLKPYNLTYQEITYLIKKQKLTGVIAHPYTIGTTSIIKKLGKEKYKHYIKQLKNIELTNTSFNHIQNILKYSKKLNKRINQIRKLPEEDTINTKLLTAGSDAHTFKELGTYVTIETTKNNLYKKITNNPNPIITEKNYDKINLKLLLKQTLIVSQETLIKKSIKLFS